MSETQSSASNRIPQFMLMIIFIALAFALVALAVGIYIFPEHLEFAMLFIGMGFLSAFLSAYELLRIRRRLVRLKIELPPITTTIECKKCGFKSVRGFQRGDYIFKEVEPCQKCNDKMLVTAIYREVKEKTKQSTPF